MKHTIFYLLIASAIILMLDACASSKTIKSRAKREAVAKQIIARQQNCTGPGIPNPNPCNNSVVTSNDCSINSEYCRNECISKILYCHEICRTEFDALTIDADGNRLNSNAFTTQQFHSVIDTNSCPGRALKCYIKRRWFRTYYKIAGVNSTAGAGDSYETFYSVALLRGILNYSGSSVDSIKLYRGTKIDEGGVAINLIPIEVFYSDGTTKYYDLSNDFP